MLQRTCARAASAVLLVLTSGAAGVAGSKLWAADEKPHGHPQPAAVNHSAEIKPHLAMVHDPEGSKMMRDHMTLMLAHQILLHDLQDHPETKQMLQQAMQDANVAAIVQQVKADMVDPQKRLAKVAEVKKDHKEMMMVLAHALMRQNPELKKLMKEDHEAGKH
jgi:flagellar motor protein MotB